MKSPRQVRSDIRTSSRVALLDLQSVLDTKLLAIRDIQDREVAEQKLRNFRDQFGEASQRFEGAVKKRVDLLGERLEDRRKQHATLVDNIALLAERELVAFEMNDVGRHWRTRRSGYWGYMSDFQTSFAPIEQVERQDRAFDNAAKDLFRNYGVTLTLRRETGLHDRFLMLDTGVLFKLGRGLDIYKPAVGLAEHRSANRRVRQTGIDVFCRPGHALVAVKA